MVVYHYFATANIGIGKVAQLDGLITRDRPAVNESDYLDMKRAIGAYHGYDISLITICSLTKME